MDEPLCSVSYQLASSSGASGSRSWGSGLGQLVTDSRPSTVNSYSSRVRSTGPKGHLPFFREKKPWIVSGRDSNVGRDACGARAPGYRPLTGPSLSTPHFKKGTRSGCQTHRWANLRTPGPRRAVVEFLALYPLPVMGHGPFVEAKHPVGFSREWTEIACARPVARHGGRSWQAWRSR